jgi:CRISPR-associated protein Csb1
MSEILKKFDSWLGDDGPAALVIREHLIPVEGADGVFFPSTFAASEDKTFKGGYNIDRFDSEFEAKMKWDSQESKGDYAVRLSDRRGEHNVCLIDSVGSQANRIEPLFAKEKYAGLVPQVTIKAGEKIVNLLEAGHRAGDAIVRCTPLQQLLLDAFTDEKHGNVEPLARVAPTSLVFGFWDSRQTQSKRPRLIASTIRAYDVHSLKRSAQYNPPMDYAEIEVFSDDDKKNAEGDSKSPLAKRGFVHHPASGSHGGVIATGGIRRDATLSLAALRLLNAGTDKNKTEALRRYILGLALVAFTYRPSSYLRQGCNLVLDPDKPAEFVEVGNDGRRHPSKITHEDAIAYAAAAAKAFGIGKDQEVEFDKELAKKDVQGDAAATGDQGKTKGKKK